MPVATFAELVLVPVDGAGGRRAGAQRSTACSRVRLRCWDRRTAARRRATARSRANGELRACWSRPGTTTSTRRAARSRRIDRAEIASGRRRRARADAARRASLPLLCRAGVAVGRLPRARRRQLRLVDPRRGSGGQLPGRRASTSSSRPTTTSSPATARSLDNLRAHDRLVVHAGRRADAQHPLVRRPRRRSSRRRVGHFNFWPRPLDASLPRNGAPWDELREPGPDDGRHRADLLRPGARACGSSITRSPSKLGRDQGFLRDRLRPAHAHRTPGAQLRRRRAARAARRPGQPPQHRLGRAGGDDRGRRVANWLRYRALWFSLLSQGFVRAGTANSDTHSLARRARSATRATSCSAATSATRSTSRRFDADIRAGTWRARTVRSRRDDHRRRDGAYRPGLDPIQVSPTAQLVIHGAPPRPGFR